MYYVDTKAVLDYAFDVRERHKRAKALIIESNTGIQIIS